MESLRALGRGVGLLFYVVEPSELAEVQLKLGNNVGVDDLSHVPDYIGMAIPYFVLAIVVEGLLAFALYRRKAYRWSETIASLSLGVLMLLVGVVYASFTTATYTSIWREYRLFEPPVDSVATFVAALLAIDCGYYWFHRLAHENHWMWAAHSVHHSGEDYNVATALRQGALQGLSSWVFYLPLALAFHPAAFLMHKALNTLVQFWIHTDYIGRLPLGLEYIVNTASHHRVHHRPPGNCNYAGFLIIWDRMFGTFRPELSQKDYYGLAKQYTTFDPVAANVEHFRRMVESVVDGGGGVKELAHRLCCARRARHKCVCDVRGLFRPLPEVKGEHGVRPGASVRVKLEGDASGNHWATLMYCTANYLVALVATLVLMKAWYSNIPRTTWWVCFVAVAWTLSATGRLLDGVRKGHVTETLRLWCLAVCVLFCRESRALAPVLGAGGFGERYGVGIVMTWVCAWGAVAAVASRTPTA